MNLQPSPLGFEGPCAERPSRSKLIGSSLEGQHFEALNRAPSLDGHRLGAPILYVLAETRQALPSTWLLAFTRPLHLEGVRA